MKKNRKESKWIYDNLQWNNRKKRKVFGTELVCILKRMKFKNKSSFYFTLGAVKNDKSCCPYDLFHFVKRKIVYLFNLYIFVYHFVSSYFASKCETHLTLTNSIESFWRAKSRNIYFSYWLREFSHFLFLIRSDFLDVYLIHTRFDFRKDLCQFEFLSFSLA